MKQAYDRDGAIERYVNGTMPPGEQNEFMSRLEWDGNLRRAVDAELLIRTSVQTSRVSAPAPSVESRARFLTMLATVAPEPAAVTTVDPATTAATAGKGGSLMNAVAGSGIVKGVLATVASVAVAIGTIVILPESSDREGMGAGKERNAPAGIVQPAPAMPELPGENGSSLQAEPAGTLPLEMNAPDANLQGSPTPAGTPAHGTATDLKPGTSTPMTSARPDAHLAREKSTAQATQNQAPKGNATALQAEQSDAEARSRQDIPVVKDDRVPVTIDIKEPKINK